MEKSTNYYCNMDANTENELINRLLKALDERKISLRAMVGEAGLEYDQVNKMIKRGSKVNTVVAGKIERWLNSDNSPQEKPLPVVERGYLERSIENLTENQLRNTAVIERLVTTLERRLNLEPLHGTPGGLSGPGISDEPEGVGEVRPLDKKGKSGRR